MALKPVDRNGGSSAYASPVVEETPSGELSITCPVSGAGRMTANGNHTVCSTGRVQYFELSDGHTYGVTLNVFRTTG